MGYADVPLCRGDLEVNIPDYLQKLRNPKEAVKTAIVAIALASMSIVGTQVATGSWQVMVARLEFPMYRAEIESLRKDLTLAPCGSNAMLVAAAADMNREIEHNQESMRHWYSRWAIPAGWHSLMRIEMPCQAKH